MTSPISQEIIFENPKINLRLKLAGLWIAAMFCYIYADILGFYDDYLMSEILKGNMGPIGPITQGLKLGIAILMSLPAIMIYLSLVAKPTVCRWLNILTGALFTLVIVVTSIMSPFYYYWYFGILEITMTTTIVWLGWKWPTTVK